MPIRPRHIASRLEIGAQSMPVKSEPSDLLFELCVAFMISSASHSNAGHARNPKKINHGLLITRIKKRPWDKNLVKHLLISDIRAFRGEILVFFGGS